MRPNGNQPLPDEMDELLDDQERALLDRDDVPDEEKAEVTERLERRREARLELAAEDEPLP
jgi:hypothetical protein